MQQHIDLGPDAIDYIRWSLSHSPNTLSLYLLQTLDLEAGRAFTFAPADSDATRLAEFHEGVLGPAAAASAFEQVSSLAVAYLQRPGRHYLVFEDVLEEAGSPWLEGATVRAFTYGKEVYHFLGRKEATAEAVLQTIANAKGYVTNGILTGKPSVPALRRRGHIGATQLKVLANATDYLLTQAYDGEGFVVWTPSPPATTTPTAR